MVHIPFGIKLPGGLAQHVAKNKQAAVKNLPGRGVTAELDGKGRTTGAKATVLRLVAGGAGREKCLVFCAGEVVGALRQADLVRRRATRWRALREIGYRIVTQEHDRLPNPVGHSGIGRAAGTEQQRSNH